MRNWYFNPAMGGMKGACVCSNCGKGILTSEDCYDSDDDGGYPIFLCKGFYNDVSLHEAMTEITPRKARRSKSPIVVLRKRTGRFELVEEVKKWGKNWLVITSESDFVVSDTYNGLFRCTAKELAHLKL